LKAEKGWLQGYVLYLAERPCAFWLGDINGNRFGSDYVGYDAEFASHSPGMYLVMKVIEGFCDGHHEGVTEVDFGTGHAQYKQVLSNQEWCETSVYIFAPTFKGMSINLVRSVIVGTDQLIKKTLARTNLLQKVKKAWRGRAKLKEPVHADA
jgi:CelD/BcsL family acetyltransferase involved in cellulose biosynthesis